MFTTLVGVILGGNLADARGRRWVITANLAVSLLAGLMMVFSTNIVQFLPARFIAGLSAGVTSVVVPIYLGETAPPTLR